jgi:hypothetical protein
MLHLNDFAIQARPAGVMCAVGVNGQDICLLDNGGPLSIPFKNGKEHQEFLVGISSISSLTDSCGRQVLYLT